MSPTNAVESAAAARKRRLRKAIVFFNEIRSFGTNEISLRNVKYAFRVKYACDI